MAWAVECGQSAAKWEPCSAATAAAGFGVKFRCPFSVVLLLLVSKAQELLLLLLLLRKSLTAVRTDNTTQYVQIRTFKQCLDISLYVKGTKKEQPLRRSSKT